MFTLPLFITFILSLFLGLPSPLHAEALKKDKISHQETGELVVQGQAYLLIPANVVDITFSIAGSDSTFKGAHKKINTILATLSKKTGLSPLLKESTVDSGTSQISAASPIRIEQEYLVLGVSPDELPNIADIIVQTKGATVTQTSYRAEASEVHTQKAYAQALEQASLKAQNIATHSKQSLGSIMKIYSSEEPLPEAIRAKLIKRDGAISNGAKELNVFVTLHYSLQP